MGDETFTIVFGILLFIIAPSIVILLALREKRKRQVLGDVTEVKESNVRKCVQCGSEMVSAYIEGGGLGDWCQACNSSTEKVIDKEQPLIYWVVYVLSWPFIIIGGIGLAKELSPIIYKGKEYAIILARPWGWIAFLLLAGVILIIGLVLRSFSERLKK